MPRVSLRHIRKQEITDAAIEVIGEVGVQDATLSVIGKRAGLSPPLMVHYFDDKSLIIESCMRRLSAVLVREFRAQMPADASHAERIDALIDSCFSRANFAPGMMSTWLEFWLQVPRKPNLKRLHKAIAARFWSNMSFAFSGLVPPEAVDDGVQGLSAMIDGFWWRYAIDADSVDLEQAKRVCRTFVQQYTESHVVQTESRA